MKRISKLLLPLYLLAGICLTSTMSNGSEDDRNILVEIPVFRGGYDILRELDPSRESKSITYRVQTNYPAAEIIEFYDSYLNGRGWISSFEICQRHWAESDSGSEYSGLPEKQMFVSWQHPDLNLKLVLWLKYGLATTLRSDEVIVEGRLQSMSDKQSADLD
jgi:hypothetical protein